MGISLYLGPSLGSYVDPPLFHPGEGEGSSQGKNEKDQSSLPDYLGPNIVYGYGRYYL